MVKIILLYLTLVSCGYIIKVLPEEPIKSEPIKVHTPPSPPAKTSVDTPAKTSAKAPSTPEIDRHEPAPVIIEEKEVKKEKSLVPLPPKG